MEHWSNIQKKVLKRSVQFAEAYIAKHTGSVKTIQGTEIVTGKCDEQKCTQKVLHEVSVKIKRDDDWQCSASAHLTKYNETVYL